MNIHDPERGTSLVEYALIVALVCVVGIAALAALQTALGTMLAHVIDHMNDHDVH